MGEAVPTLSPQIIHVIVGKQSRQWTCLLKTKLCWEEKERDRCKMQCNDRARMRGPSWAPCSITSIANRLLWDNGELLDRRLGERILGISWEGKWHVYTWKYLQSLEMHLEVGIWPRWGWHGATVARLDHCLIGDGIWGSAYHSFSFVYIWSSHNKKRFKDVVKVLRTLLKEERDIHHSDEQRKGKNWPAH